MVQGHGLLVAVRRSRLAVCRSERCGFRCLLDWWAGRSGRSGVTVVVGDVAAIRQMPLGEPVPPVRVWPLQRFRAAFGACCGVDVMVYPAVSLPHR